MRRWICCVLLLAITLTGCGALTGRAESTMPDLPPVTVQTATVVAEGTVESARWVTLRAVAAGRVDEVLVAEGDHVEGGSPVVTLDAEVAALTVRQAEAALVVAEAKLAEVRAASRPEEMALMDAQVAVATATLTQSIAVLNGTFSGQTQAGVAGVRADILAAQVAYDAANEAHDDTMSCYIVTEADGSKREICPALGTFEEMARARVEAAVATLDAARAELDATERTGWTTSEVARADVAIAEAGIRAAEAARDQASAGSRDEAVAIAEAALDAAAAAVAKAQSSLDAATMSAPFDGVVVEVAVASGEAVAAGTPLLTVAALDALRIRTRDLTELDVVRVSPGQQVVVRADADPGVVLAGRVSKIEPQSKDYLGDVTYAVLVDLDAVPGWLRWGMTVDAEIGEPDAVAISAGGGGGGQALAAHASPANSDIALIAEAAPIAEAVVLPSQDVGVGALGGGDVTEVAVTVGSVVESGDLLLRLDDDAQRHAVVEAEAMLHSAEAALALAKAGTRPEMLAEAQAELMVAQAELGRAEAQHNHVAAQVGDAQIAAATAALASAQADKREIEAYLLWAEDDDDDTRVAKWQLKLAAVNQRIAAIELELEALPRERWSRLQVTAAGVETARARIGVAEAKLALLAAGPADEPVAVTEAQVAQARVAVEAARLQLARTEVRAPVAGTVAAVTVEVGDALMPGQAAITIADLDHLEVRTTDLLEVDVAHVMVGQPVAVKFDALPDQRLSGTVRRIGHRYELYRGDVTYPVSIDLDETPAALRWGMSAVIEFHP